MKTFLDLQRMSSLAYFFQRMSSLCRPFSDPVRFRSWNVPVELYHNFEHGTCFLQVSMCFWDSKGQEIDSWLTLLYQEAKERKPQ